MFLLLTSFRQLFERERVYWRQLVSKEGKKIITKDNNTIQQKVFYRSKNYIEVDLTQ